RSTTLNTEMGFLIDSPTIATALSRALDRAETFYSVAESTDGTIVWTEVDNNGAIQTHDREPNTSAIERGVVRFMSWLPIEWIL
ncbi:phospholipase D family protein, partial [Sulfitobacter sp. M23508]